MAELPESEQPHMPQDESADEKEPLLITDSMLAEQPVVAHGKEGRIDFERGMSAAPPVTLAIAGMCVIVFFIALGAGALESEETITAAGALTRRHVLGGEIWRPFSAMFLHGGLDHLFGNCVALWILGMACEHAFGKLRFILLYFACGLCGTILSLAASAGPSVGASGAIMGLQGALIVFLYTHRETFYVRDKRVAIVLLAWAVYTIGTGFVTPFVDNFAHLGGLAGGAGLALRLPSRLLLPASRQPG